MTIFASYNDCRRFWRRGQVMGFIKKLAGQTAVYGISTIVVRFLSYLLTPYFTRIFGQQTYGIVTDVYSLIPFALVVLTMGMESSYFRFAAKATDEEGRRRVFNTTWGVTSAAAAVFFILVVIFLHPIARAMGPDYAMHPQYVVLVGLIIMFDVWSCIPFSRLRQMDRAFTFVGIKCLNVVTNVALAIAFGIAGLYETRLGVGWVFVANLAASIVTFVAILFTGTGFCPKVDGRLLKSIFAYSIPLLVGGVAGTANEFIDRQFIKYLIPMNSEAMAQLGIYGAVTKVAVVMMLFTQMYRLAAEPFFLANFKKSDFVATNAAAMKYYVMVSMLIFLGIALFRDVFALIVGPQFRVGMFVLPVVLGANVLSGVWLNLSFWYKREEKTRFAIVVTFVGLIFTVVFNLMLIPRWGYYGAAWARLASEASMVAVSLYLNRRYFPTPYQWGRIAEYVFLGAGLFAVSEIVTPHAGLALQYVCNACLVCIYILYAARREKILLMLKTR